MNDVIGMHDEWVSCVVRWRHQLLVGCKLYHCPRSVYFIALLITSLSNSSSSWRTMIESLRALAYECCCCAAELQRWLPPPPPAVRLNCRLGKPYDLEPTTTTSKASEYQEEWEVNEYSSNAKWGKVIWSLAATAAAARRIIIPFSFRGSWSVLAVKGSSSLSFFREFVSLSLQLCMRLRGIGGVLGWLMAWCITDALTIRVLGSGTDDGAVMGERFVRSSSAAKGGQSNSERTNERLLGIFVNRMNEQLIICYIKTSAIV